MTGEGNMRESDVSPRDRIRVYIFLLGLGVMDAVVRRLRGVGDAPRRKGKVVFDETHMRTAMGLIACAAAQDVGFARAEGQYGHNTRRSIMHTFCTLDSWGRSEQDNTTDRNNSGSRQVSHQSDKT